MQKIEDILSDYKWKNVPLEETINLLRVSFKDERKNLGQNPCGEIKLEQAGVYRSPTGIFWRTAGKALKDLSTDLMRQGGYYVVGGLGLTTPQLYTYQGVQAPGGGVSHYIFSPTDCPTDLVGLRMLSIRQSQVDAGTYIINDAVRT